MIETRFQALVWSLCALALFAVAAPLVLLARLIRLVKRGRG